MRLLLTIFLNLSFLCLLEAELPNIIDVPQEAKKTSPLNLPQPSTTQQRTKVNKAPLPIYFLTSNPGKYAEVKALLPNVKNLTLDLPEIQSIDPRQIIYAKLQEALKYHEGQFIVEDTSLNLEALNGLPGPLIKWFELKLGNSGIVDLVRALGNDKAEAITYFGYAEGPGKIHFFEGRLKGRIVPIRGDFGFGWDPIFEPEGQTKTLAEMDPDFKNSLSMRKEALIKLKAYIDSQTQMHP